MSKQKTRDQTETSELNESDEEQGCPECSGNLVEGGTDLYCTDCGLVTETRELDRGPEWRAFDAKEKEEKRRVGAPETAMLHDKGHSTVVSHKNKDANGNAVDADKADRLRKWQKRVNYGKNKGKSVRRLLTELARIASVLDIPNRVKREAASLCRDTKEEDLVRGRTAESIAASCLLIACRRQGIPLSLTDLTKASGKSRKQVIRTYRKVCSHLNIAVLPPTPSDYVQQMMTDMRLHVDDFHEFSDALETLVDEVENKNLHSGRDSRIVVVGCMYYVARKRGIAGQQGKITQHLLADKFDMSEVAIRNTCRRIEDSREVEDDE